MSAITLTNVHFSVPPILVSSATCTACGKRIVGNTPETMEKKWREHRVQVHAVPAAPRG